MDDKIIKDKFHTIIKSLENCHNKFEYRSKLIELGFEYNDDEAMDPEIIEERAAKPENDRQCRLVAFFNSTQELSQSILDDFLAEKSLTTPNYPLIRRYFRLANKQLKQLLLFGLERNPLDRGLLDDLAYFNEFSLNLTELIGWYSRACRETNEPTEFKDLVQDFYDVTLEYDYDVFHALLNDKQIAVEKKHTIKNLQVAIESEKEAVDF